MKKILSLLLVALMLVGMLPMNAIHAHAAEVSATITFDDTSKRTVGNTSQQVWEENGITFTNDKASSTSNVNTTYFNPIRLYAKSSATIAYSGTITKIEVTCSSDSYATVIATSAGSEATASGTVVTIVPTVASSSYSIDSFSAQTRVNSITVYATVADEGGEQDCAHANTTEVAAVDATCTASGFTAGVQCTDCNEFISGHETVQPLGHSNYVAIGEAIAPTCTSAGMTAGEKCGVCGTVITKQAEIAKLPHEYVDGTCSVCGAQEPAGFILTSLSDISETDTVIITATKTGDYAGTYALSNDKGTSAAPTAVLVTITGETLTANDISNLQWNIKKDGDNLTFYPVGSTDKWLYCTSTNNGVRVGTNDANVFTLEASSGYLKHTGTLRYLGVYNDQDWRCYTASTATNIAGQTFAFYVQKEAGSDEPAGCAHENTTTNTVAASCTEAGSETVTCADCGETVSTTEIPMIDHTYVDNICSVCGAEFEGEVDTTDPTDPEATDPAEEVKITFELGDDGDATHNDGTSATTYTETVDGCTLDITESTKMYTGAIDATGNGCIKLGTSSAVGGFTFTVPSDVIQVIIRVAKYKDKTSKVNINGTEYTLTQNSNAGAYDEITVDTSSSKTVNVTTVSGSARAMVNSITFVCGKTDHTCQWDEGTVTKEATCTTDGERTYSCTVEGCAITITETIKATGHSYVYGDATITCANCDYSAAYTLSTIADAKAYTDTTLVYYIKGIVTYVSGKNVYIEDATGGICVYFATADEAAGIELGDEILVWDTITAYKSLIETSSTTAQEYLKVSSGNALPSQTVTLAALKADATNEYLGERVVIENVTIGTINNSGNTALTDADGNTLNIHKVSGLSEDINENDTVTATVIVSTYDGYQLLVNPGTAATDVVETAAGEETVVTTVTIAEAKAGTAGEYYQVEGVVTFIDGRNVYIQDATGGIVVYLTATDENTAIGDKVKAYGALKTYNGLIELDGIDATNTEFYSILSNDNTVESQAITIADLAADTTNEYLAEKITLTNVYVSYSYGYSSSYANVNYILKDGENTAVLYRVPAASEEAVMAGGTIVTVEAIVSSYNGYQLRVVGIDSITVTGTCAHETTELVNVKAATLTEGGYTGDRECTVCGNYTERGTDTDPLTDVTSWGLVLRDAIDVKFQINIDSSILDTAVVKITVGEKTYEYKASEYVNADDSYVYVSASVAAAQMTDEITVTVINGEDQAENSGYTIKTYAETILSGDYDDDTKAMVTAMVHYGAAAQTYFAYNLNNMVNEITSLEGYTEPDLTGIEIAAPSVSGSAEGITFYGASLVFENKIAVRFYFVGDAGEIEGAVAKDDKFYIEVAGINPQDLDDAVTVTIGELSVSYSPMNYIVRMAEKNENEDLVALVKALYNYHVAAEKIVPDVV